MSSSVINFAYGGDPNGKGGLEEGEWRGAFDGEGKGMGVMVVDGKEGGGGMVRIGNEEWMGEEEKGDGLQRDRGRGIRWERLVERCAFIDGIAEEVGV